VAGPPQDGVFGRRDSPRAALEQDVEALIRRMAVENERLAHAFADRHRLHATDLQALIHVMDAEGRGAPLTPGELAAALSLTSGSTTAVIDRLEKHELIRRDRDDADRRKVHLRFAPRGMAISLEFFGGLQGASDAVMAQFTDEELDAVRRFLSRMSDVLAAHRDAVVDSSPT
jgi:DNA-binding MarR family transcriptional regulator